LADSTFLSNTQKDKAKSVMIGGP